MSGARRLVGVTVGDTPAAWEAIGFDVVDDRITVGGVTLHLVGDAGSRGVLARSLDPPAAGDGDAEGRIVGLFASRAPRRASWGRRLT